MLPFPTRGFSQGTRNNIADFESQRFAVERLNRVTDAQWEDAFEAADYAPDIRDRYIKKIKAKIAEGLAVS